MYDYNKMSVDNFYGTKGKGKGKKRKCIAVTPCAGSATSNDGHHRQVIPASPVSKKAYISSVIDARVPKKPRGTPKKSPWYHRILFGEGEEDDVNVGASTSTRRPRNSHFVPPSPSSPPPSRHLSDEDFQEGFDTLSDSGSEYNPSESSFHISSDDNYGSGDRVPVDITEDENDETFVVSHEVESMEVGDDATGEGGMEEGEGGMGESDGVGIPNSSIGRGTRGRRGESEEACTNSP